MSKIKLPAPKIDGSQITQSVKGLIDYAKYRKYAKEGYTTVISINEQNNTIRIRDGQIDGTTLTVKGNQSIYLVNKQYILPTKKLVTKCVIVKEDLPDTLDLLSPYDAKQTKQLLNKFTQLKLMEEFNTFNMGQVLLGALAGIILGALGLMLLQMMGGIMIT